MQYNNISEEAAPAEYAGELPEATSGSSTSKPQGSTMGKFKGNTTVLSRRFLRLRPDDESDGNLYEILEPFANLEWHIYRVSPLYNFDNREVRLKQYALKLQDYLLSQNICGNNVIKARFKDIPDLIGNEKRIVKVQVEIHDNDFGKEVYLGYFMSWNSSKGDMQNEEFLHLPILLCKGHESMKQHVHSALKMFFDCFMTPYCIPEVDLTWLNCLFLSVSGNEDKAVIKFTFDPAWKAENPHQWEVLLSLGEIRTIWKLIHPEDQDYITVEEVKTLHDGIIKTVSQGSGFNLLKYRLKSIHYPDVRVKQSGKFLCKTGEIMNELLHFLCSDELYLDVLSLT